MSSRQKQVRRCTGSLVPYRRLSPTAPSRLQGVARVYVLGQSLPIHIVVVASFLAWNEGSERVVSSVESRFTCSWECGTPLPIHQYGSCNIWPIVSKWWILRYCLWSLGLVGLPDEWKEKLGSTIYTQLPSSNHASQVIDVLDYAAKRNLVDGIDDIRKECASHNQRIPSWLLRT